MFCFLIDPAGWAEVQGEAFAPGLFDEGRDKMLRFTRERAAFVRCELERGARRGCESVIGQ